MSNLPIDHAPLGEMGRGIWEALHTDHAECGEVRGAAGRYRPEISVFAGLQHFDRSAFQDLATLMQPGEACALVDLPELPADSVFAVVNRFVARQMVAMTPLAAPAEAEELEMLDATHGGEMFALAKLTDPGPFGAQTYRMGRYLGVFDAGRLVAMGGERLRIGAFCEVSGICTHPDYRGCGYAGKIVQALTHDMQQRGSVPFLHVRVGSPSEQGAAALYQRLGYVEVRRVVLSLVQKRPSTV